MDDTEGTGGAVPKFERRDRMRLALRHGGLTPAAMAEALSVSASTIRNYLSGRTTPSGAVMKVWAWRCDVDEQWLVTGEGQAAATPPPARDDRLRIVSST